MPAVVGWNGACDERGWWMPPPSSAKKYEELVVSVLVAWMPKIDI